MLQATCSPWTITALLVVSAFLILASHDFAFIVFTRICMRRVQVLSIALGLTQRVGALEVRLGIEILARVRSLLAALNYALLLSVRLPADHEQISCCPICSPDRDGQESLRPWFVASPLRVLSPGSALRGGDRVVVRFPVPPHVAAA